MGRTNLLIVVLGEKDTGKTAFKDSGAADIVCVDPSQVRAVNEAVHGRQASEVLIACEGQEMGQGYLNQLLEILYSCERHGAVVSLNADSHGICRMTRKQYERISKYLDGYRVIPRIESFPVLIRTEMFERFGMLDENFHGIAGALADFSLRFNQYGWSTVRVNCWNDSGGHFGTYLESDKDIIQKRYPYIQEIEEIYYAGQERAAEHFAGALMLDEGRKPGLLFSLYEVPAVYNGTANYALKLLEAFWGGYHEKYEISILVKKSTDEFYRLSEKYPRVYYPENVTQYTFRLGYVVSQVLHAEHMDIINKCCLKYSICMLDIICLRSHYLCKNDVDRFDLFRDSVEYSDLMLSISQFSHDDIASFFRAEMQNAHIKTGVLYLGTDKETSGAKPDRVTGPFKEGDYFIVIGNPYKHKMIEPVLEVLKNVEGNFIVIGTKTEGFYHGSKRIYGYVSGWLNSGILEGMIAGSKCIIFPSVYEGFGLTLYDAVVYRKKIIVSDTQVNIELRQLLGEYRSQIITYRRLEELGKILAAGVFGDSMAGQAIKVRSWQEAARDLEAWLHDMHEEETDIIRLERRWRYLKRYRNEGSKAAAGKSSEGREKLIRKCISSFPGLYKLYRKFVTAIDKEHYGSC